MIDYRKHVEAAIQSTTIHSATTYSWFGKRSQPLPPLVRRALSPDVARSYLLFTLQSQLYSDFYCQGFAQATRQNIAAETAGRTPFVEALTAANTGSGYWTTGRVHQTGEDHTFLVQNRGLHIWVRPEECVSTAGDPLVPGAVVRLRFPKEFLVLSPGFYMAFGNEELVHEEAQTIVRWYWNLTARGAVRFLGRATFMLNQLRIPYKLKVLNDPMRFSRCDAVVLYIRKTDFDVVSHGLAEIYPEVDADIKPGIPVFTKLLAAGVGLAEDPGQGESFGLHRCGLLSEGLIHAHELRKKSAGERLSSVEDSFAKQGIDLTKPFLNPGSWDDYRFPVSLPLHPRKIPTSNGTGQEIDSSDFLQTAIQIGNRLSQEAVWYEGRCNWMGLETEGHVLGGGLTRIVCRALGPELYSGTSGVALFLAALHGVTGDIAVRDTALGAVRQALSTLESVPSLIRFGLYTGLSGIAFAAAWVGTLLHEEELLDGARQVLKRMTRDYQTEREIDLLSGVAGAVAALVILRDLLDEDPLVDFAANLGDALLNSIDKSQTGYSWSSSSYPDQPNLTGFSHGAAGVGYALLELFNVTGNPSYRHAAEQAFSYERHLFDREAGNWPDLRTELGRSRHPPSPAIFATAWCHGAPGIALSRLRAYHILKEEIYKAEAVTALRTTHNAVEESLHARMGTFSLCHGLAGNADILVHGFQVLGQEQAKGLNLAHQVAGTGIARYLQPGNEWPCGPGGETPSFMVGLAGIGYFYLRLYDNTLPSLLMLQRESFSPLGT